MEASILLPRMTQALLSTLGDAAACSVCLRHFGPRALRFFMAVYPTRYRRKIGTRFPFLEKKFRLFFLFSVSHFCARFRIKLHAQLCFAECFLKNFLPLSSWFLNYCSSRPLVNSFEAALTSIALMLYPTPDSSSRKESPRWWRVKLNQLSIFPNSFKME